MLPPQDSEVRARVLARLAAGPLGVEGDPSRSRRFALTAEAVEIARRLGDPAVLAWALDGRKVAIWAPDTLEEQWEIMDELREIAERCGDPEQIVDARICRLIKLIERSELDQYEAEHAAAARVADELGQPGQRWLVAIARRRCTHSSAAGWPGRRRDRAGLRARTRRGSVERTDVQVAPACRALHAPGASP